MDTYTEANHKPIHTAALKADVLLILNYFCLVKICTISDWIHLLLLWNLQGSTNLGLLPKDENLVFSWGNWSHRRQPWNIHKEHRDEAYLTYQDWSNGFSFKFCSPPLLYFRFWNIILVYLDLSYHILVYIVQRNPTWYRITSPIPSHLKIKFQSKATGYWAKAQMPSMIHLLKSCWSEGPRSHKFTQTLALFLSHTSQDG